MASEHGGISDGTLADMRRRDRQTRVELWQPIPHQTHPLPEGMCVWGGGGGVLGPKSLCTKDGPTRFPGGKFRFFPQWSLCSGDGMEMCPAPVLTWPEAPGSETLWLTCQGVAGSPALDSSYAIPFILSHRTLEGYAFAGTVLPPVALVSVLCRGDDAIPVASHILALSLCTLCHVLSH